MIRLAGIFVTAALLAALAVALVPNAWAKDRHAGYYYPEPVTTEVYGARAQTLADASRRTRIGFVTGITAQQRDRPYAPRYAMFAKGAESEKLLIVSLYEGHLDTLFRARAFLAMMTAVARTTEFFRKYQVEEIFTFLDMLKMLGFSQITISDGRNYAHQIQIK